MWWSCVTNSTSSAPWSDRKKIRHLEESCLAIKKSEEKFDMEQEEVLSLSYCLIKWVYWAQILARKDRRKNERGVRFGSKIMRRKMWGWLRCLHRIKGQILQMRTKVVSVHLKNCPILSFSPPKLVSCTWAVVKVIHILCGDFNMSSSVWPFRIANPF